MHIAMIYVLVARFQTQLLGSLSSATDIDSEFHIVSLNLDCSYLNPMILGIPLNFKPMYDYDAGAVGQIQLIQTLTKGTRVYRI